MATVDEVEGAEPSAPPPDYNAVVQQLTPSQRARQGLSLSFQVAGASVGRWFGVHDDQLTGWPRTGTLPRNDHWEASYNALPQTDDMAMQTSRPNTPRSLRGGGRVAGEEGDLESLSDPSQLPKRGRRKLGRCMPGLLGQRSTRRIETPEEIQRSLPTFWPVVTVLVAIVEAVLLIAVIAYFGLAPVNVRPESKTESVLGFNNKSTIVTRMTVPNFFIGPSSEALVHTGGMYTPCMRENLEFLIEAAKELYEERNLRCCKGTLGECGVLPLQECYDGEVLGGASVCLAEMNITNVTNAQCRGNVTLHPCCIGLLGHCIVTSKANCTFQGGYWHPDKVLCSEVGTDCFKDICEFTWIHRTIGQLPSQGMRFVTASFLYQGVVHLVLVGGFKLYESWIVERRIGWLRLICIYLLSGIGGFLVSGLFDPKAVSVGGSGVLFGLFGVLLVELLQSWKRVKRPCLELAKLLGQIIVLAILGTLPYIDNFSQIGGFIFGLLSSFIFVPYINIGKWDRVKKLCLVLTVFPVIFFLYLFGFVAFYNVKNPNFCPKCSYINCIPYTPTFCDDFILTIFDSLTPGSNIIPVA